MAITYMHCYVNARRDVDWNTCGQAAIATISDYHGRNPANYWPKGPSLPREKQDPRNGLWYWDDGKAIDVVKGSGYGPDVAFGLGTSGGRIRDALVKYGLSRTTTGHSGAFSWGWEFQWDRLRAYLSVNRPVPVIVDLGQMGGPGWLHHWAIAYRYANARVYLGACPWNEAPTEREFLSAWHSSSLPYGFNHCGVYT